MIFYFSGTGNSEWVAKQIGTAINEEVINIIDINRDENVIIKSGQTVGFVFPIYAWLMPDIMRNFINNIEFQEGTFIFSVCTCGSEAGNTFKVMAKDIPLNSCYSISMPNNYIIGSSDVDSEEKALIKIENAKKKIQLICSEISKKQNCERIDKGIFPFVKTSIVGPLFNKYAMDAKPFFAEDTCISCGLCEKRCPTNNIKIIEGKPKWGNECLMCLSCINRCPKEAIQYGKQTKNKGRYYFK